MGCISDKNLNTLPMNLKRLLIWGHFTFFQNGASYITDSNDFKSKIKNIDIPNDALLITADIVGLYPSIPHEAGLSALREAFD